jgi:hypothetical protein
MLHGIRHCDSLAFWVEALFGGATEGRYEVGVDQVTQLHAAAHRVV